MGAVYFLSFFQGLIFTATALFWNLKLYIIVTNKTDKGDDISKSKQLYLDICINELTPTVSIKLIYDHDFFFSNFPFDN